MAASYPTTVKTFATIVNGQASDATQIDAIYDEVTAIETGLLNGLTHVVSNSVQPRALAFHSTTQSLSNTTFTTILFDSETLDVGACHDTVSNTSRLTVPAGGGGLYLIFGCVFYAANVTGIRVARLMKNAGAVQIGTAGIVAGASGSGAGSAVQVLTIAELVAGDFVYMDGYQDSGGPLNAGSATLRYQQNQLGFVKLW